MTLRNLMQWYGEMIKMVFNKNHWIDIVIDKLKFSVKDIKLKKATL